MNIYVISACVLLYTLFTFFAALSLNCLHNTNMQQHVAQTSASSVKLIRCKTNACNWHITQSCSSENVSLLCSDVWMLTVTESECLYLCCLLSSSTVLLRLVICMAGHQCRFPDSILIHKLTLAYGINSLTALP